MNAVTGSVAVVVRRAHYVLSAVGQPQIIFKAHACVYTSWSVTHITQARKYPTDCEH